MSKWLCICGKLQSNVGVPDPCAYHYMLEAEWLASSWGEGKDPDTKIFTQCDGCGALCFKRDDYKFEFFMPAKLEEPPND